MNKVIRISGIVVAAVFIAACGTITNRNAATLNTNAAVANTSAVPTSSPAATGSVSLTPSLSPLPPDPQGVQAAIHAVREYYSAVNDRDYRKAYELWSGKGEASGKTFNEFRDGYLDTDSVELDTSGEPGNPEGAAGSQYVKIPVRLKARMKDGKVQNFWGEYTLRRSMVDGATPEQRSWRIYSAEIKELD